MTASCFDECFVSDGHVVDMLRVIICVGSIHHSLYRITSINIVVRYQPLHDDVIKWKNFPGIHPSPVNSPHKGQWRGGMMFSLICAWINGWVNTRDAGDLRRHQTHYDVTVTPSKGLPFPTLCVRMSVHTLADPRLLCISLHVFNINFKLVTLSPYIWGCCSWVLFEFLKSDMRRD